MQQEQICTENQNLPLDFDSLRKEDKKKQTNIKRN